MSGWERQRSLADAHHRQPERDCEDFGIMPPYNTSRVSELSVRELDAAKEAHSGGDITTYSNTVKYHKPPPPAAARQNMMSAGSQFGVLQPGWTSGSRSGAQQSRIPSTLLSGPNRGCDMLSGLRSSVVNGSNTPLSPFLGTTSEPNMLGTPARSTPHGSQHRRDTGLKTTPGDFGSSDPVARSGLLSDFRGLTLTSSPPEPHRPVSRNGKFVKE